MFLIASDAGGYLQSLGWAKDSKEKVEPIDATTNRDALADGYDADGLSEQPIWQTIAEHTDAVCCVLETILSALCEGGLALPESALRLAAPGMIAVSPTTYSRPRFPRMPRIPPASGRRHQAGSGDIVAGTFATNWPRHWLRFRPRPNSSRKTFEVLWPISSPPITERSGFPFGRCLTRESRLISMAFNNPILFLRVEFGTWTLLEAVNLGAEAGRVPDVMLSLEPMKLGLGSDGEPSWTDRMLQLRDRADLGPFRLAFLETVLRAGDCRASAAASISVHNPDSSDAREGTL